MRVTLIDGNGQPILDQVNPDLYTAVILQDGTVLEWDATPGDWHLTRR